MPNIDVKYDLAMAPGPGKTRVYFSQGDRGLGTATLSLFANSYPLYLEEGITAMIVGRKPDKTAYAYDCQISRDRRSVIVTVAEQMTAVAGTGEAQIIFTDGDGNVAGTCNFEVVVEADPTEGTTPSESDYAVFYQAIAAAGEAQAAAEAAEAAAEAAQEAAAENFDLIFTAPITDPPVIQTAIPATVNHTEEEVTAAYAAGKKVNAKIHLTFGTPISFDLEPVYTVAMQTDNTEKHMYSGLLVAGIEQLDAYVVMAMWENGEPVIMIVGKISDYAEAVAGLETEVTDLGNTVTAVEADQPVAVALSITATAITAAIEESQRTGEAATVNPERITADPADADAIYAARQAGKRIRFDLTAETGGSTTIRTSATRCRNAPEGRDIIHYYVTFDHADLCGYFTGLDMLKIDYRYNANGRNSVTVTVEAQ